MGSPLLAKQYAIKKSRIDGFDAYQLDDGTDYYGIYQAFKDGDLPFETKSDNGLRGVYIVSSGEKSYVLKYDKKPIKYLECKISRWIRGPVFSRIMKESTRALSEGCDIIQHVYLVLEKMVNGLAKESISLVEYLPGAPLEDELHIGSHNDEIRHAIERIHSHKLAFIDAHPGNFLVTPDGIKIIDLTFRDGFYFGRAKDIIRLKEIFNIDLASYGVVSDLLVGVIRANQYLRNFFRVLRNHPKAKKNAKDFQARFGEWESSKSGAAKNAVNDNPRL